MKFFDSHAHLDDEKFNEDREELIESLKNSMEKVISAGYNIESSKNAIALSNKYDFIYATCGISPNDIPQKEDELWITLKELKELLNKKKKIVAVGEIGLDYYWNKDNKDLQKLAFIEQIKIANENNLPIVIHSRDAAVDTIDILKENTTKLPGVFHCCQHNEELVKNALDLGFYISFAGPVTYKNAKKADEIIKMVPNDKMLIETDSPYLSPEPLRGTRNNPSLVKFVAEKIATVKGMSVEKIAQITSQNTRKVFGIK